MSVAQLKEAMLAKAADAPKTNEDETNKGIGNVRTQPADRKPGTLDAKWGDHPTHEPDVYGEGVVREARDTRGGLIERIFDSQRTSAPAEQALMSRLLTHAREGHPHSPLLQRGRPPEEKTASDETLTDQVSRVVGFR
jgi:hypothetical protein